eukprot:CAMPEP_0118932814 /NCGR_PEP_ID=MMETSP1169-20130426/10634_1 /TAXON_ID=36882 /ORGANISM="Pyramimonas obovata, Strain CCMP722" /LENGTH=125 /DNA_ID=CAMNT_0006875515 /DNA_START=114 /DNA_END=487 /DNA_ORIENTATION=-
MSSTANLAMAVRARAMSGRSASMTSKHFHGASLASHIASARRVDRRGGNRSMRLVVDTKAQDIKTLEAKQKEVQQAASRLDKLQEELLKQFEERKRLHKLLLEKLESHEEAPFSEAPPPPTFQPP